MEAVRVPPLIAQRVVVIAQVEVVVVVQEVEVALIAQEEVAQAWIVQAQVVQSITCASPTPYFLPNKTSSIRYSQYSYSSKEPVPQAVLWCATFSPIACYIFTRITKYPIRKPMGVSSFAGALDGLIWGYKYLDYPRVIWRGPWREVSGVPRGRIF